MKMSQNTPDKEDQSSTNKKNISLPISRVRLIMKSSPDVSSINQDALFLTTKATELFVQHLAVASFNNGPGKATNSLSYTDLANTAEEMETFHFLTGELGCRLYRPAGTVMFSASSSLRWCVLL
uniref:Chromatin accessibility complex protein 1 n=1 Tax=Gasterosteus aculeatus aculeatus TaxID=481459 RepID=A0AAQ4QA39_GASAC